ncbi:MAG: hypothetical protein DWQ47_06270 [Acidobacteria bacterium]|nr:MAG: hypothetical protein DWQ32_09820 [Acidobacteriota bacterium]REK01980.1 MAG: hypothetical protein DWQ38_06255 [Acidobacteriota bacterium]REK14937.1 MAG: hypothetical protein DWQ43_15510 [Acidobacteriota bacterium]REK45651.1 MAG: hypothetical protein DWQ47_06270 [Acidobacteriota bacterium]
MLLRYFSISAVVFVILVAGYVFISNMFVIQPGKIVITDADINAAPVDSFERASAAGDDGEDIVPSQVVFGNSEYEGNRMLGDLSIISSTVDGYGNRTETRVFRSHPRLNQVLLKTNNDGTRVAYVYGHFGNVRMFTGAKAATVMTESGDTIANAAEIFETRLDKDRQMRVFTKKEPEALTETEDEPVTTIASGESDRTEEEDQEAPQSSTEYDDIE